MARGHRGERDLVGQPARDQRVHSDCERHPEVHLGQAPEPAVGAHDPEIVRAREHGAGTERMPVHRGQGGQREGQDPAEQAVHEIEVTVHAVEVGEQPVGVEAVAEEFPGGRRDQGGGP